MPPSGDRRPRHHRSLHLPRRLVLALHLQVMELQKGHNNQARYLDSHPRPGHIGDPDDGHDMLHHVLYPRGEGFRHV